MSTFRSPIGYPNVLGMVMAGGEGSRLHPLTNERAKPAVFFGGKYRIIDFVLNNFINSGIFKIKVLTQFKSDSLIQHLNSGWSLNRMLGQYVDPVPAQMRTGRNWYMGTADAVFQNLNIIADENPDYVAVFGADHIYKMDISQMLDFHRRAEAVATIAAMPKPVSEAHQFGIIEVDANGKMIGFEEKPAHPKTIPGNPSMCLISMGNYIFNKKFLVRELFNDAGMQNSSHDFGKDVFSTIYKEYPVYVYDFTHNRIPGELDTHHCYWKDVGTLESYFNANMTLRSIEPELNIYNEAWPIRTAPGQSPPAKFVYAGDGADKHMGEAHESIFSVGCVLRGGRVLRSVLSRGVCVNNNAVVEDSILFPDVVIGEHARIRRAIIDRGAVIASNDSIGFDAEADTKRFTVSESRIVVVGQPSANYFL